MVRPFALIGFTFVITLFSAALFGRAAAVALALCGGIALVFSLVLFVLKKAEKRRTVIASVGAVMMIAVGWITVYTQMFYAPALSLDGKQVTVQAEIVDLPRNQYNKWYYSLRAKSIDGSECDIPIRFSSSKPLDAEPYDIITAEMKLYEIGKDNADTQMRYKSKGCVIGGYALKSSEVDIEHTESKPIHFYILRFRKWITSQLEILLPGSEGALLKGMLLGDKSSMSQEEQSWFRTIGVSHLMAVSGLHVSVWLGALMWMLSKLRIPHRLKPLIGILFTVFFVSLTGFSVSAMRAGLMMVIVLVGTVISEQADSLNSLGIAAIFITLNNPYAVLDLGFLLSFSATAGIVICAPKFQKIVENKLSFLDGKKVQKLILFCAQIICITLSAILFTLPIQVFFIGEFSLISPLSNLLMTNAGGIAMVCAGVAVIFSGAGILSFLKYPFAFTAGILAKYLLHLAKLLSEIPYASIRVDYLYVKLWVIVTVALTLFAVFAMHKNKLFLRATAITSAALLIVGTVSYSLVHFGETKITVLDVGNGSSVLVTYGRNSALIGCGGDYFADSAINSELQKNHVDELLLLFVPRNYETENSAVDSVLSSVNVLHVASSYDDESFSSVPKQQRIIAPSGEISLWDNTSLKFINKDTQSCALLTAGETKILFSFCPAVKLTELPYEWYGADVLICREAVPEDAPSYTAVVLSGDSDKTSEYKSRSSGEVFTTQTDGNVTIYTKGNHLISVRRENSGSYWRKGVKTAD